MQYALTYAYNHVAEKDTTRIFLLTDGKDSSKYTSIQRVDYFAAVAPIYAIGTDMDFLR